MSEYISREAAISKIRDEGVLGGDYDAYEREEDVVDTLKSIPAADVAPVRHGRWEQVEILHVEDLKEEDKDCISIASMFCPKCKRYHSEVYMYGSPTESVRYCPNCGAVMDGGQDDGKA